MYKVIYDMDQSSSVINSQNAPLSLLIMTHIRQEWKEKSLKIGVDNHQHYPFIYLSPSPPLPPKKP